MKISLIFLILNTVCLAQILRIPNTEFNPRKYICYTADEEILIDGVPDKIQWSKSPWSEEFVNIRGNDSEKPVYKTRMKMLWDADYLYLAAELEENNITAKYQCHDDTLVYENNFELFIDPDGDTGKYCEIELNALNTVWDLFLVHPYRDEKKSAISAWDLKNIRTAVHLYGTLNVPGDKDSIWTVEAAVPWKSFLEITDISLPPKNGDQWRINFCRTEWINNKPEFWSWSPQGLVNMHYPEMWGYVQFSDKKVGTEMTGFINRPEDAAKWYLRRVYYAMRIYYNNHGRYTDDFEKLSLKEMKIPGFISPAKIEFTSDSFEAFIISENNSAKISIDEQGLISFKSLN